MNVIKTKRESGAQNMATDEALLHCATEQIIRVYNWQTPTISIGRLQKRSDVQEIVPIIRRPTGGSAVYHDSNTDLTYAIIKKVTNKQICYNENCQIIIKILAELNINAKLQENGDITVEGKKISGNAQRIHKGWSLQHGTLLIEKQNHTTAAKALQIKENNLEEQTTYVNKYTKTTKEEIEKLLQENLPQRELTQKEQETKETLLKKYESREWNESGTKTKGACYLN